MVGQTVACEGRGHSWPFRNQEAIAKATPLVAAPITLTSMSLAPLRSQRLPGFAPAVRQPAATVAPATPGERLSQLWVHQFETPARTSAALRTEDPAAARSLALYAHQLGEESDESIVEAARIHYVINTEAALEPASSFSTGDAPTASLLTYANELGFGEVRIDGERRLFLRTGDEPIDLRSIESKARSADQWLRAVGRKVNTVYAGVEQLVPATRPVDTHATGPHLDNALTSAHLSALAYRDQAQVEQHLEVMGFDMSSFRWLRGEKTATHGFTVANDRGERFFAFRGTSSLANFKTDAMALPVTPTWQAPSGTLIHHGFGQAVDDVWPQIEQALRDSKETGTFFAGHSLGGAIAQLAGVRAVGAGLAHPDSQVYTQGSPRVGNDVFKRYADRLVRNNWRVVNQREGWLGTSDPVAATPPKWLGFRHAGNVMQVDPDAVRLIDAKSPTAAASLAMAPALESMALESVSARRGRDSDNFTPRPETDAADARTEALRGEELSDFYDQLFVDDPFQTEAPPASLRRGMPPQMALESMVVPKWTGVPLHFLSGYLDNTGREVTRRLDAEPIG